MAIRLDELCPALRDPVLQSATFLNEIASRYPAALSLAAGRPPDDFFNSMDIAENISVYQAYLMETLRLDQAEITRRLFQYGRTAGYIHELVARTLANDEGIEVDPAAIVVVVGAQEGMLITLRALCHRRDDVLLVTEPCYIGVLGAAKLLGLNVVAVPMDADGLDPAAVAAVARAVRAGGRRPRALYLVPTASNPSGHTLSIRRRHELIAVAGTEDLLIIEDDPYGFLADGADQVPTLKALDRSRRVVHIGTFAKTCFPGARVGYVVADQPVQHADGTVSTLADQLSLIRSMTTVNTSSVAQAVIGGMLVRAGCRLREFNAERVARYRSSLRLMLTNLDHHLPEGRRRELGISWSTPDTGFFVVVRVPFVVDEALLRRSADVYGVLWTPMSYFYVDGGGRHELRICCSSLAPAELPEAIRRLASLLEHTATARGGRRR